MRKSINPGTMPRTYPKTGGGAPITWSCAAQALVLVTCLWSEVSWAANVAPDDVVPKAPLTVTVGLTVTAIRDVDDARGTFFADFYLEAQWIRPECSTRAEGQQRLMFSREEALQGDVPLFDPAIEFANSYLREETRRQHEQWIVHADGRCTYSARFSGVFRSTFDLHRFPFDSQHLEIQLESSNHGRSTLLLATGRTNAMDELAAHIDLPNWSIVDTSFRAGDGSYPYFIDDESSYSRVTLSFEVERRSTHYLWKFLVPLVLIVLLSWLVFWMGPRELQAQMQVSITCVLSVIAFNFVMVDQLPRVGYLTTLDLWVLLAYLFASLGTVQNVVAHYLFSTGNEAASVRVDRFARVWVPLTYLVLNALVIVRVALLPALPG